MIHPLMLALPELTLVVYVEPDATLISVEVA